MLISNLISLFFWGDKFLTLLQPSSQTNHYYLELTVMTYLKSSIISSSLLVFSGACLTSSLRFFTLRCLCHRVSNDWLFETLKNKLFLEQSLKLSLASVMPSLFVLISFATFVFGRLLTVFSLSLKYEASQLRNRFFFLISSLPVLPHNFLNRILLLFCFFLPDY